MTDTNGNGDKHYLSDYPETISAEIGGLYEEPKLWRDMTDAEKGALLLAHHEGATLQVLSVVNWYDVEKMVCDPDATYRIKPEPKVEVVALCYRQDVGQVKNRITFNLIDGEPDCDSIKMEKVQ